MHRFREPVLSMHKRQTRSVSKDNAIIHAMPQVEYKLDTALRVKFRTSLADATPNHKDESVTAPCRFTWDAWVWMWLIRLWTCMLSLLPAQWSVVVVPLTGEVKVGLGELNQLVSSAQVA